ncbi:MAG: DUF4859 domain-containing protein [Bacteroidaceae bacterium]|nr:DUF4859 domain-containing protein [Bacteroidaceae bacterium]
MRKIYYSLWVLMLMMVSTTVKAQYEATIETGPTNDWVAGQQSFAATDIATALGLADAAALKELINSSVKSETEISGPFYIKTADGKSNQYTGNANEFWMDDEGQPHEYSGASWFVGIEFEDADSEYNDEGKDRVNIYVGQMPQTFTKKYEASSLKTTVYLVNGGKEISFAVTQNIAAATESAIKVETTKISELTFVKDYSITLNFNVGGQYEGNTVTATLDGIYDALGVNAADLDASIDENISGVYAQLVTTANDETVLQDELQPSRVPTDGWFGRHTIWDEATATETVLPVNMLHSWGEGCTFYVQNVKLTDGELSIKVGQFPGTLKAGDTDAAYLYIIAGKKAVRVLVQVDLGSAPEPVDDVPFENCTEAGSTTVDVYNYAMPDYSTKAFSIDIDDVLKKLGCEANALTDFYAYASEGVLATEHTTGEGGFYFNEEGYVDTWGNKAPVYINYNSLPEGKFAIGQYGGYFLGKVAGFDDKAITEPYLFKTKFLYKYSDKYYTVNVNFTIYPEGWEIEEVDPGVNPDSEFDIVTTLPITMQIIPSSNYYAGESEEAQQQMQYDLGLEKIQELIGTGSYTVYGLKAPASTKVYPELTTSTGYTPNAGFSGGFWMGMPNEEKLGSEYVNTSFVASWGTNAYGIEWKPGEAILGFDQIPDQRKVGDFYVSTFYWVNSSNNKAIKYELSVVYVDEIVPMAEVVDVVSTTEAIAKDKIEKIGGSEFYDVTLDKAKVAAALGITEAQFSEVQMSYAQSVGVWASLNPGESSQYFNANGYEDVEKGVEAAVSEDYVVTLTLDDVALGADDKITLRYAFDYDNKRVLYTLQLGAEGSKVVGISDVKTTKADSAWYTLSGVKVARPTAKGAYIHNGKKVYMK